MKYSFYPGCTLKSKAQKLEKSALAAAEELGIELRELDEWQCCGGVYPLAGDELITKLAAVRGLVSARERGEKLVTLCTACHHVLKRVNHVLAEDGEKRETVNDYLELSQPYEGETEVIHYLELLAEEIGFSELGTMIGSGLDGRKIAAHYGCMLLRPAEIMEFDDPENPEILENFIEALGGQAVSLSRSNECCGGYHALQNEELASEMSSEILRSAENQGAEEIVTACPLCKYNFTQTMNVENKNSLKAVYICEILEEALGITSHISL